MSIARTGRGSRRRQTRDLHRQLSTGSRGTERLLICLFLTARIKLSTGVDQSIKIENRSLHYLGFLGKSDCSGGGAAVRVGHAVLATIRSPRSPLFLPPLLPVFRLHQARTQSLRGTMPVPTCPVRPVPVAHGWVRTWFPSPNAPRIDSGRVVRRAHRACSHPAQRGGNRRRGFLGGRRGRGLRRGARRPRRVRVRGGAISDTRPRAAHPAARVDCRRGARWRRGGGGVARPGHDESASARRR